MNVTWKLAWSYAWGHPVRMLLTSLAIVAAATVVVWVVSGYDAMVSQFDDRTAEYLGRYDMFLVPDTADETSLSPDLLDAVRQDPDIAEFEPLLQVAVRVQPNKPVEMGMGEPRGREGRGPGRGPAGSPPGRKPGAPPAGNATGNRPPRPGRGMFAVSPKLIGTQAAIPPYEIVEGRWLDYRDPALREAVISKQSAEQLKVGLGDEVLVISGTKEFNLTIVGVAAQVTSPPTRQRRSPTGRPIMTGFGATLGPAASALYVPMPLAGKISQQPGRVNLVSMKLREGASAGEFQNRWLPRVAQSSPAALLVDAHAIQSALDEGMMAANARRQAWAATGMSLLAALFIIFTTLSMGVDERVRQFAVMRAVGLTRGHIAAVIGIESAMLAVIGWAGGLAAGWGLLQVVGSAKPELFGEGVSLGSWCILLSGLTALGGALAAAILPAWQATRRRPLDAAAPRQSARPRNSSLLAISAAAIALIAVNPLLVYVMPIDNAARYGIYMAVGCTTMAIGFLLLAPLTIVGVEALLGPVTARLAALEPRLLRSQLGSNMWRTLGATVALTVGLGLYVAMMVWGYSMLQPFRPGDWVPDMLVAFQSGGLPDSEVDAIRNTEGVIAEQCLPLAVEQPRLFGDITGSEQGSSVTRQDNVIVIGLDPQIAFGGPTPLLKPEFVQGDRDEAVAKLAHGRHCLVPDHFLAATGLRIGDRFEVVPPKRPDEPIAYTIAGAVSLPGWHWMTKFSGLRRRSGRSAAIVFTSYDEARRDYELDQINFFWTNIDRSVGAARIGAALQPIADRHLGEAQPVNAQGTWEVGATMFGRSLRITTPDEVRSRILARADTMIWAMCQLPLITLLVTSLGVINTVVASVRARRWELGVLRAVGVTRSAMFRMILVEGLLIAMVACLISLGFGVLAGWCGTGISQYVSFFGGMHTPLVIPWPKLLLGFGLTAALCVAAALAPAVMAGRTEPLQLLQKGRSGL